MSAAKRPLFRQRRLLIDVYHLEVVAALQMFLADRAHVLDGTNGSRRHAGHVQAKRAFDAVMPMKKIDVATIEKARRG